MFHVDALCFDPDINQEVIDAFAQDRPAAAAELKKRAQEIIVLKNGYYETANGDGSEVRTIVVEELRIRASSLYVSTLAETDDCKLILFNVQDVLRKYCVPSGCLEDSSDEYATTTTVKLSRGIELLFSKVLREKLIPAVMNAAKADGKTQVVIHPYSIEMKVHQWKSDALTPSDAAPESWDFTISHEKFDDHDKK